MLNILNVAQTGLHVARTQVEGVMNDLANENTVGYKNRTVDVSELDHADSRVTGRGAGVDGVSRSTNIYMYQNLVKEEAKQTSLEELDVMLNDIESIFYETDDSGLSSDLNRYFSSIENLRTSPQNEIYKDDIKNNASVLIDTLQTLYTNIEQRETTTLNRAKDTVEEINSILTSIGDVSRKINDSITTPNDLLDKRDALEKELAQYIDVELFREDSYELKIGGTTAVRFDTNIHTLNLVENYTPQKDVYVQTGVLPLTSNLVNTATWGTPKAEVQTLAVTGAVDDGSGDAPGTAKTVHFLGTAIPGAVMGDTAENTIDRIITDTLGANTIITNWNAANPTREIDTITKSSAGELTITYLNTEGDVPIIDSNYSQDITYANSVETVKGTGEDSLTYALNNEVSITVTNGETITDAAGNPIDLNGDSVVDATDNVDNTNVIKALVYKINNSKNTLSDITAYNGPYELAADGSKILTNNPKHSDYDIANPNKDRYLIIESTIDGEAGAFVGEITVQDNDNVDVDGNYIGVHVTKDTTWSEEGIDDIHLEIFEEEVELKAGSLKPMIDNIKSDATSNKFVQYKEKLDQFAKTISDLSSAFIETGEDTYIHGLNASEIDKDKSKLVNIGLFSGASVKNLEFNDNMVNTLTQEKLDYLATIQWKDDIDFDGTGLNNSSFSKFYQNLRANIADDRETVIFKKESQTSVTESMQNTYDKLTKVDKDKEMVELIKYQSAYEANAKMITTLDEMLQTLLGLKR